MSELRKLVLFGLLVILFASTATFISQKYYNSVDRDWQEFSEKTVRAYVLHATLIEELGYGGFIHHFKNLVLRHDIDYYAPKAQKAIENALAIINEMRELGEYDEENTQSLTETLDHYLHNLLTAQALIRQGKPISEVDKLVKVDDTAASAALNQFNEQMNQKLAQKKELLQNDFRRAFYIHIGSILLFIITLIVFIYKVVHSYLAQSRLAKEALAASKAKSDFLANMSHEIRTPINAILGTLQILDRDFPDSDHNPLIKSTIYSTKSLVTILNDILDITKFADKQLIIEHVPFSLRRITESIESDYLPIAIEKSIQFEVNVDPALFDNRLGDPVRVRQVLLNLVSNAIKFTEFGSVALNVYRKSENPDVDVVFEIKDTGIGMNSETQNRLFKRFTQADSSTTRRYGGSGLGLAISKSLVDLMKGTIHVQSRPNYGTTMTVTIPLFPSEEELNLMSQGASQCHLDLTDRVILIAEDNPLNALIYRSMLSPTKATIQVAENGQEAVALFESLDPDIILMDIQMPVMDGIEACRRIREKNAAVPIIAVTANVMMEDIETYEQEGFDDHVGKPLELTLLLGTIERFIKTEPAELKS
ncbi:ATP-binding protein [Pseudoalteromonas xiamenensis]